jgi:dipeptidyl aminopeptidase/acylaminoacyl peptidase
VQFDGEDIYWLEQRPSDNGRSVIVCRTPSGVVTDLTPTPYNVRSRVHEYGGGSFIVSDGTAYFSNFSDNGVYVVSIGSEPRLLTTIGESRHADFILDETHGRLLCIQEDHSVAGASPKNSLVSIRISDGYVEPLVSGADFYASPSLSADGARLAWLSWDLPNMPWDGTELWQAVVSPSGSLINQKLVAGGVNESVFQPTWSPEGILHYVSDRNGWWNLYRDIDGLSEALWVKDAEFGQPQWVFGQSTYAFGGTDTIICTYTQNGSWLLALIETNSDRVTEIDTDYTVISSIRANLTHAAFVGASPTRMPEVVALDLAVGKYDVLKQSSTVLIANDYVSIAEPIEFPTAEGVTAFANYYPPKNDEFIAPDGELPPLLVACHGGPTSASYNQLNLSLQFWTSRGFAFVTVNYGGSTGYGREYHERLNGAWGIVDVDDSVNCALYLADEAKADSRRLTIHGGSAGGYTALSALTFHEVFAAGASLYGVSDLAALATDTHKFESRYLDRLVGPYPERSDLYKERSPIYFVEKLSSPIIFFQGLDDKIVPPDQAVKMVDALKEQNIPVAYVPFEGEGHGFRKSASIKRCLEAHFYFYCKIFGIETADPIIPVEIVGFETP